MPCCHAQPHPSEWGTGKPSGTLTGVLDCSVSFCSHIFRRLSRSLSSCSLKLRSRSSFFSLSRVASISHLHRDNCFKSQLCSRNIKCLVGPSECSINVTGLKTCAFKPNSNLSVIKKSFISFEINRSFLVWKNKFEIL